MVISNNSYDGPEISGPNQQRFLMAGYFSQLLQG
jgi:hypothetical protein